MGSLSCSLLLSGSSLEPIPEVSLRLFTFKTVFLLLLASGCRRGELHSLSFSSLSHVPHWRNLVLRPLASFISKLCSGLKVLLL